MNTSNLNNLEKNTLTPEELEKYRTLLNTNSLNNISSHLLHKNENNDKNLLSDDKLEQYLENISLNSIQKPNIQAIRDKVLGNTFEKKLPKNK